jgi:tRNA-2-methylthio-N6-dimethylallyladenosine synthase
MTLNKEQKTFYVETYGCQMNVNDSEKVAGLLRADGLQPAPSAEAADFVFINTCAVREKSTEKLYSSLGRLSELRRERGGALRIGVGGCVAQLHGTEILERAPAIDLLVGPHNLGRVPELLKLADGWAPRVDLDRKADAFTVPAERIDHSNPYRAYVTVMEGCNHVCSFCVVPRTRGPEVCRPPEAVLAEVRMLVARGVPEVMLLGQTVNAYRAGGCDFAELLARVDSMPGLERLRFTTSHPAHMTPSVARRLGQLGKLGPYIHLPVQSGSDRVLASMRRGHTRAQYLERIACLRAEIHDLALSSDVIVGYPGETPADFEDTVRLLEEAAFDGLFSFAYSPRPGTTALYLPDDVPDVEKRRRLQIVNDLQQAAQAARNRRRIGLRETVLVEGESRPGRLWGRTPHFRILHFDGDRALLGRTLEIEVTDAGPNSLVGRIPEPGPSLTGSGALPIF